MRLEDKVAIVTGAGTGIGKEIAKEFAVQGARVVLAGNIQEDIENAVQEIYKDGYEVQAIVTDVTKIDQVQNLMQKTTEYYSSIDILVNNAAVQLYGTAETMEEADWNKIIEVNLKGPFLCSKYAIPYMKKQGYGSIINMGSVTGLVGTPNLLAYSTAKGGIHAMTRTAAVELAENHIRVNAIAPGTIQTPILERHLKNESDNPEKALEAFKNIHPVKRLGQPYEIASACVYLASDESAFVTGSTMVIDGGYTVKGELP